MARRAAHPLAPLPGGVVTRHQGALLRRARAFLSGPAAEDAVQDTWAAALQGLSRFEGRSSLRTWLLRILANRARTRRARERREVPFSAFERDGDPGAAAAGPERSGAGRWTEPAGLEDPETLLLRAETRAALEAALARLSPRQRAVITLRDVEGLGAEEAREALRLSEANQRVLLHRARARVRAALEAHLRAA
ncbi:MAG TPA: sigma-70 family RNA polymerase sigma factor [Anaeromyxobacteraceae bacterium]|jgi:RNA polymerase sigma-70 factor (ECF subfamily)